MKKILLSVCSIFAVAAVTPAYAQDETTDETIEETVKYKKGADDVWVHFDANFGTYQFETSEGSTTYVSDSLLATHFRAGVKYSYFGAEVEYGSSISAIEEDDVNLDLGSQIGIFGIARMPADNYDFYLRAGYHSSTFEGSVDGVSGTVDLDADGFAFGFGGSYYFADNFGVRADLTAYNAKDIVDAAFIGGSIGLTARF